MTELDRDFIMLQFALTECRRALDNLAEVDELAGSRVQRQPGVEVRENLRVFDRIRLGLQMAANVSRLFWSPRNAARGAHLRSLTGITEDHGLSDRTLRNHIEHIDERLDAWTEFSPRPFHMIELVLDDDNPDAGEMREQVIGATAIIYDARSRTIQLFGDVFSLPELRENLEDALEKISEALKKIAESWT